VTTKLVLLVT